MHQQPQFVGARVTGEAEFRLDLLKPLFYIIHPHPTFLVLPFLVFLHSTYHHFDLLFVRLPSSRSKLPEIVVCFA